MDTCGTFCVDGEVVPCWYVTVVLLGICTHIHMRACVCLYVCARMLIVCLHTSGIYSPARDI